MGKVKKKKFAAAKPRPTGLPSVGECETELDGQMDTPASLQNIIEKVNICTCIKKIRISQIVV